MQMWFCPKFIDLRAGSGLPSDTPLPSDRFMTGSASYPWNSSRRSGSGWPLATALLLVLCAGPMFGGVARAQKHERRHEIDHLEDAWRNALLRDDTTALGALLADDYMAITPAGTLQTKDEALANLRSGHMHFTILDISDRKVRFYGATALVTSTAAVQATGPEGNNLSGSYRYTRVYVEGPPGVWKIVSFEANRIIGPGYRK
jgi:ketosteroid isomerase-like protein